MADIDIAAAAEDDGKSAEEGGKRSKLLIGLTSSSILLGFIIMVVGCLMLSQYSDFVIYHTKIQIGCFGKMTLCYCDATLLLY